MRWNDLSMAKKLAIGFGFVGLLLVTISTVSWLGFSKLSTKINQNIYLNESAEIMLKREIDHMNWQNKVIIFLLDENSTTLKVSSDDHACKLGKWLYGEGRKKAEQTLPSLSPMLKQLEIPHKNLHDSAGEIQKAVKENDGFKDEAIQIYNTKSRKALQGVKAGLHGIAVEIEKHITEANTGLQSEVKLKTRMIIILTGFAILLACLFSFFLARKISTTLRQSVDLAESLAEGNLTKRLDLQQKDELGLLATALNTMADKLNLMIGNMNSEVLGLASTSNELNVIAQSMAESSGNVSERASSVAAATEQLSGNMNSVAAASEEASTNVNIVATASEEVTNSIAEVDTKTREARNITEDAVQLANSSSVKVDALGEAANQISKVTEVITEISDQTNLLALNATIEAARAGEAGKGFAVVANEIKELAKQTAAATGEIRSSIESMQGSTDETVAEIRQITEVIGRVDEIVAGITDSVAEQTATTNEIAENIQQAAMGIGEVNENVAQSSTSSVEIANDINEVSDLAGDLSTTGNTVEESANDLASIADTLKAMVTQFKINAATAEQLSDRSSSKTVRDLLRWDHSLTTGLNTIDQQHKQLVVLINDLHRAMKLGSSVRESGVILDKLVRYTGSHFATEERLFQQHNYPEASQHKEHHSKLVAQVMDSQKEFKGGNAVLSAELMDFLKDWLVNHIKKTDMEYVPFLKKCGVK